ncbi:MAG: hypothetical protein GW947_00385 [Candidatus Pacebacteria bacterium]|nr:hypothetical protein [Candidatus Paceibacterota bacterium]PIR61148.1 MAG: hypothetical protein COU68_00960 [Candidatus Pacebacteria bacterium CG10_big_fil_rev_8_21_14_0_10_45_6]
MSNFERQNSNPVNRASLSKEEAERHWPQGRPEAIVFASASLRKGLLLHLWLQLLGGTSPGKSITPDFVGEVQLDFSSPLAFQQSVEAQIRNGDGTAIQSVLIGYLYGVPIILDPQNGETRSNNALGESENKIASVSERYAGKDVIIFACDTVGEVEKTNNSWIRFGKPRNEPEFAENVKSLGSEVWKLFYLWDHYWRSDGAPVPLKHTNALLVKYAEKKVSSNTTLSLEVPHDFDRVFTFFTVFLESGGGGIFQQLIDWTNNTLDKISDLEMKRALAQLPEEQQPWYLMFDIMGVQAWQLLEVLSEVAGLQYTDLETESVHT